MDIRRWSFLGACCFLVAFVFGDAAQAFHLDRDRLCSISGEFQTRGSWRTQDSEGFTGPSVAAGNLVQHRTLFYLEVRHDLRKVNWPANFNVKYHLRARFLYEGVYDYGPDNFQDIPNDNYVREIDEFQWDASLWEAYVDISRGPLFFRLGRQNLSWGETDLIRLLDNINPLDDTFGGIFEDFDDRRIPLIMARSSYNFGKIGPVQSFTLEGFWVPGWWDNNMAPLAPPGTPYALPIPPAAGGSVPGIFNIYERLDNPGEKSSSSRWGFRVQGVIGNNLTVALAHYRSFLDQPVGRFVVDQQGFLFPRPGLANDVAIELGFKRIKITGASMNYYERHLNMVIRSEFAYLEDVPVLIPAINTPDPTLVLFPRPALQFSNGRIPKKDQVRFSLSLDKDVWVRALNPVAQFNFTLQYTGQYTKDHDDRMVQGPIPNYPDPLDFDANVKRCEQQLVLLIMNQGGWMNGKLFPEFVTVYDFRGVYMFQPSVLYRFDPFQVKVTYSAIEGNFLFFGFFEDRDQVTLNFSWLF
jgi:hypothetical protein